MDMNQITSYVQVLFDGLTAGIAAVFKIASGTKSYASASEDAATGTGSMGDAAKIIYNFVASGFGYNAVK